MLFDSLWKPRPPRSSGKEDREMCIRDRHQYLLDAMLPQMIVGGFVTVTITSVIIAGIFIGLL